MIKNSCGTSYRNLCGGQTAGLSRGDDVSIPVEDNRVVITKADSDRAAALEIGRKFRLRYERTFKALAKWLRAHLAESAG